MTNVVRANRTIEDRARFGVGSDTQDDNTDPATDEIELTAEGVVENAAIDVSAANVTVDSTTLVGTGTTVQAVFEELDDALAATASVITQQADQALSGTAANSELLFAVAASKAYSFHATMRFTAVSNGASVAISFASPAGAVGAWSVKFAPLTSGTVTHSVGDFTSELTGGDAGVGGIMQVTVEGTVLNSVTAGNVAVKVKRSGAAGTLTKGSSLWYSGASA